MKRPLHILLAIVAIAVVLGIWECAGSPFVLGVRTPFESSAEYHLRMMYYHGRETKDGRDGIHADQLVALGEPAVPVLAEAVSYGFNPRYDPKPHEMLARFPAAAHAELARRIRTLPEVPEAKRRSHFLFHRVNLTTALILVSNDWTYLDQWLDDVQELYETWEDDPIQFMDKMLHALLENESAPQPFIRAEAGGPRTINPGFVKWWKTNRPRITARENREGFRNAAGWKSGWYRDQERLSDHDGAF